MWWKISLALIIGLVSGVVISTLSFRQMYAYVFEWQTREIAPWSSANKDWREFSIFLRYGGRVSLLGEVSQRLETQPGMSEPDVRSLFGPPDQVAVGAELNPYPGVYTKGRAGAYFYKVGPCSAEPMPYCVVFVIVFDHNGKVIDSQNLGVPSDEQLANFDNDTRSDRMIAQ